MLINHIDIIRPIIIVLNNLLDCKTHIKVFKTSQLVLSFDFSLINPVDQTFDHRHISIFKAAISAFFHVSKLVFQNTNVINFHFLKIEFVGKSLHIISSF